MDYIELSQTSNLKRALFSIMYVYKLWSNMLETYKVKPRRYRDPYLAYEENLKYIWI